MIPWPLVSLIDLIAWRLGYDMAVTAQGGPGFHRGRIGADCLSFTPRDPNAKRLPRLKPDVNWQPQAIEPHHTIAEPLGYLDRIQAHREVALEKMRVRQYATIVLKDGTEVHGLVTAIKDAHMFRDRRNEASVTIASVRQVSLEEVASIE